MSAKAREPVPLSTPRLFPTASSIATLLSATTILDKLFLDLRGSRQPRAVGSGQADCAFVGVAPTHSWRGFKIGAPARVKFEKEILVIDWIAPSKLFGIV